MNNQESEKPKQQYQPSVHTLKTDAAELLKKEKLSFLDLLSREKRHQKVEEEFMASPKRGHKTFLVFVIVVALFALVGLSFWLILKEPKLVITPSIPQSIFVPTETNIIRIRSDDHVGFLEELRRLKKERVGVKQLRYLPVEIVNFDGTAHFADPLDFFSLAELSPPTDFTNSLGSKWALYLYSRLEGEDVVLVFEVLNKDRAFEGIFSWERDLIHEFAQFLALPPPGGLHFFEDKVIKNLDSRLLTFGDPNNIIGYTIVGGRLVVMATSLEALEETIERFALGALNI